MTTKVFIDGAAGTTGLEIRERLAARGDLSVSALPEAERKDEAARARALNSADLVILCLPDDAARQAVSLIDNPKVRVIVSSGHLQKENVMVLEGLGVKTFLDKPYTAEKLLRALQTALAPEEDIVTTE